MAAQELGAQDCEDTALAKRLPDAPPNTSQTPPVSLITCPTRAGGLPSDNTAILVTGPPLCVPMEGAAGKSLHAGSDRQPELTVPSTFSSGQLLTVV